MAAVARNHIDTFTQFIDCFSECISLNEAAPVNRAAVVTKYKQMRQLYSEKSLCVIFPDAKEHFDFIAKQFNLLQLFPEDRSNYTERFALIRDELILLGQTVLGLNVIAQRIPIPNGVLAAPAESIVLPAITAPIAMAVPEPVLIAESAVVEKTDAENEEAHALFYASLFSDKALKKQLDKISVTLFSDPIHEFPLTDLQNLEREKLNQQNLNYHITKDVLIGNKDAEEGRAIVLLAVTFVRLQHKNLKAFSAHFSEFLTRLVPKPRANERTKDESNCRVQKLKNLIDAIVKLFSAEQELPYRNRALDLTAEYALLTICCWDDLGYCPFFEPHLQWISSDKTRAKMKFFIKQQAQIAKHGPAYVEILKQMKVEILKL